MSTETELDRLLKETKSLIIGKDFKGVVFSDMHMGTKGPADDFCKNEELFNRTFHKYIIRGFMPFFLGDVIELWENKKLNEIMTTYPSVFGRIGIWQRIKGNHDQELELPEAIVLEYVETGKKILMVHGYQGDFWTSTAYPMGKFFVRHVWKNLQLLGMKDPTTATEGNPGKHEKIRETIDRWSMQNHQTVIWGHTHYAEENRPYNFNCGSWVGNGGQCVEIVGEEISVKFFT